MSSIFTKIINQEIPCYKIAEDEHYFAFLDISPNAIGHTLCVPKQEVDRILDLEEEVYIGLMRFSRKVGKAIEKAIPCNRVGITVVGLEVPHAHVHLIPINTMGDMNFKNKINLTTEEFIDIAATIKVHL